MNRLRLAQRALSVLDRFREMAATDPADVDNGPDDPVEDEDEHFEFYGPAGFMREVVDGTPFVFSDDLTDVVEAATLSLPSFRFAPTDLRAPAGFVLFARPLPLDDLDVEDGEPVMMHGFAWCGAEDAAGNPIGVNLGEFEAFEHAGGVRSEIWRSPRTVLFGELIPGVDGVPRTESGCDRFVAAAWRILLERIVVPEAHWIPRAVRRRSSLSAFTFGNLHLWTLREAKRRDTDEHSGATLTTRHIVSAHWKQQWYPSEGRHAPILVAAYQRGPKSAPLVVRRRVGVVIR